MIDWLKYFMHYWRHRMGLKHNKIFLFLLFFLMHCRSFALAPIDRILLPSYNVRELKIFDEKPFLNSYIIFLHDEYLNVFLVKKTYVAKPEAAIKEVVSSWIAREIDIPANDVRIVPARGALATKLKLVAPATIHTLVPGRPVAGYSCSSCFKIRQTLKGESTDQGLAYKVIHNMAFHPDLPRIVALDTFTGNHDRNNKNLFYDNVSDNFFAIDFGGTFKANLARLALVTIERIMQGNYILTRQEIYGLQRYCDTLKQLSSKVQPDDVLQKIARAESSVAGADVFEMQNMQMVFLDNYVSCQELICMVNKFISPHVQNEPGQVDGYVAQVDGQGERSLIEQSESFVLVQSDIDMAAQEARVQAAQIGQSPIEQDLVFAPMHGQEEVIEELVEVGVVAVEEKVVEELVEVVENDDEDDDEDDDACVALMEPQVFFSGESIVEQSQALALIDSQKPYEFVTLADKHKICQWCDQAYNSQALQDFDPELRRIIVERMCAYWQVLAD